jgi:two-component system phosphate regulon sensor histidine kinase PhoR
MFRSIRWRIALPFSILIIVVTTGIGIYVSNLIRQNYLTTLENQLIRQSIILSDEFPSGISSQVSNLDYQAKADYWADKIDARVTLIAADGTVLGESDDDIQRMDNHLNRPEIQQAQQSGQGVNIRYSNTLGFDMLYAAVPIELDGQISGYVRLGYPLGQIEGTLNQIQTAIVWITLFATVMAVLLSYWVASRTTLPLRRLTETVDQVSRGNLNSRIIPTTSDEVGQLTKSFNEMADQLTAQIHALETEREKIAAVLSEMNDGVIIVDSSGKIQLINPAAANMFAINQNTVIGISLIEGLRQHQIVELWRANQRSGNVQSTIIEIPACRLYLQALATSFGKALPGSTLLLLQNMTRMRHLETVRQDFISNISHELRTPLAALKALTETLQESALDDPPAARRFLQKMETEVDSLSLMVTELLELSRIESGRVPLKMMSVSPAKLIEQSVDRLRLQAERAGLNLVIDCPPDLPDVLADPARLEQVIVNLLHNAIKFTESGGEVRIRGEHQADKILFSVQDNGIGIPREDLSRIFERFYKADRARSSGGTGLGLAIARHTVEAHAGSIWATSIEGQGSTFYFTIPVST